MNSETKVKVVLNNPSVLPLVLEALENEDQQVRLILEIAKVSNTLFDLKDISERLEPVIKQLHGASISVLKQLVAVRPSWIKFMKDFQTEELCYHLVSRLVENEKSNLSWYFRDIEKQTYVTALLAVTYDSRCYKYVVEEYRTEELKMAAVKKDPSVISDIEAPHSAELAEAAVRGRAKTVNRIKCIDPAVTERLQIMAIETTLQAMPSFESGLVTSKKVIDRFKELCIEGNYFDEEWHPQLNFSQEQLYAMLEKNPQWIDSYKIFNLLDGYYKQKAFSDGLIKYQVRSVTLDDMAQITSPELLGLMLPKLDKELRRVFIKKCSTATLHVLLELDPLLLKYFPESKQTQELCLRAVRKNPDAFEYVKNWTPVVISEFESLLREEDNA